VLFTKTLVCPSLAVVQQQREIRGTAERRYARVTEQRCGGFTLNREGLRSQFFLSVHLPTTRLTSDLIGPCMGVLSRVLYGKVPSYTVGTNVCPHRPSQAEAEELLDGLLFQPAVQLVVQSVRAIVVALVAGLFRCPCFTAFSLIQQEPREFFSSEFCKFWARAEFSLLSFDSQFKCDRKLFLLSVRARNRSSLPPPPYLPLEQMRKIYSCMAFCLSRGSFGFEPWDMGIGIVVVVSNLVMAK